MKGTAEVEFERFMGGLEKRNPGEPDFQQAVREFADTIIPFLEEHPEYREAQILERMTEPDQVLIFRVSWEDEAGSCNRSCAKSTTSASRMAMTASTWAMCVAPTSRGS